ncbi:MAG TPA: hypothetical protein VK662_00655 [Acidothermaceae bacterium]|nr:hypothetical protein [Acidothermaceae bacterium]
MGLYFMSGAQRSALGRALAAWVGARPDWQYHPQQWPQQLYGYPRTRRTPEEVAEDLVNDPQVQAVLAALITPAGQQLETAALSAVIDPVDAKLLAAALTIAFRMIRDQNRATWQRAEVLMWVGGGLFALVLVAVVVKYRAGGGKA